MSKSKNPLLEPRHCLLDIKEFKITYPKLLPLPDRSKHAAYLKRVPGPYTNNSVDPLPYRELTHIGFPCTKIIVKRSPDNDQNTEYSVYSRLSTEPKIVFDLIKPLGGLRDDCVVTTKCKINGYFIEIEFGKPKTQSLLDFLVDPRNPYKPVVTWIIYDAGSSDPAIDKFLRENLTGTYYDLVWPQTSSGVVAMRKMEDPLEVYIARRKNANNEYIYTFHITKPAMTIQFSFTTSVKNDELPSLKRIDTQEGHYISFETSPTQKRKVTAEAVEVICIDDGSDGSAGGGCNAGGGGGGGGDAGGGSTGDSGGRGGSARKAKKRAKYSKETPTTNEAAEAEAYLVPEDVEEMRICPWPSVRNHIKGFPVLEISGFTCDDKEGARKFDWIVGIYAMDESYRCHRVFPPCPQEEYDVYFVFTAYNMEFLLRKVSKNGEEVPELMFGHYYAPTHVSLYTLPDYVNGIDNEGIKYSKRGYPQNMLNLSSTLWVHMCQPRICLDPLLIPELKLSDVYGMPTTLYPERRVSWSLKLKIVVFQHYCSFVWRLKSTQDDVDLHSDECFLRFMQHLDENFKHEARDRFAELFHYRQWYDDFNWHVRDIWPKPRSYY